jgi:hypothetical protein
MTDLVLQSWFIEAVLIIASGIIVAYAVCWLFDECNREH